MDAPVSALGPTTRAARVPPLRLAVTGAITGALVFSLCWFAALLPIGAMTHLYLQLFTAAPTGSTAALAEGISWSVVFGFVAGGLIALVHNALGRLLGQA
jgi:hypothetical protein